MFRVSTAKREILRKLTEHDWSPTDLAEELGKTPETVYNHLHDLEEQGVLTTRQVPAKTRPKTEYSIDDGLIQYITVLPGQFREGSLRMDESKEVMFRIWAVPQEEFHPYLERYWWSLKSDPNIDFADGVTAIGVYGSVARGQAGPDSDIDILAVTGGGDSKSTLESAYGSVILEDGAARRVAMTEVYTVEEYKNSLAHGSDFLTSIRDELHPLYDPERTLSTPTERLIREQ